MKKNDLKTIRQFFSQLQSSLAEGGTEGVIQTLESNATTIDEIILKLDKALKLEEPKGSEAPSKANVLVVDDVESMRGFVRTVLREIGFERITLANNAKSALSLITKAAREEQPFTLVITDWEMDDISGLQLLKKIRSEESIAKTPVFILTGVQKKSMIKEAIEAGCNGYITKPINVEIMRKKFQKYVR